MNFSEIQKKFSIEKNIINKDTQINYLEKKNFQGGDLCFWGYDKIYEKYFIKLKNNKIHLCEIGILEGDKLFMLNHYFNNINLYGYDIDISKFKYNNDKKLMGNIKELKICNSINKEEVSNIKHNFDIIIDDGDHNSYSMIKTFQNFFPLLNKGGLYFIEDVCVFKGGRFLTLKNFFLKKNINYKFEINHQGFEIDKKCHGIMVISK